MHIVMQIMPEISLTYHQLHQQFMYSMVPSYTGVRRNNMKPQEAVQINKQVQYKLECYIKVGSETSLYPLVTP